MFVHCFLIRGVMGLLGIWMGKGCSGIAWIVYSGYEFEEII